MLRSSYFLEVAVLGLAVASGCNRKAEASSGAAQSQAAQTPSSAPRKSAVARLAFLDKVEACDCTKARIDKGWNALQAALGPANSIPIDRIHVDTQADQAAPLLDQRKIVAVPAVYLLDANGYLIEMLQGEIQEGEVRKALQ